MTRIFSYSTFASIFCNLQNGIRLDCFKTATGKFNLRDFVITALDTYEPGTVFSNNLISYVKFWAASWLRDNGTITEDQYNNYLAGKNKI